MVMRVSWSRLSVKSLIALLTEIPADATKTETADANGNGTTKTEDEKPNAFDKVQADEKDEGKTAAKVNLPCLMHCSYIY